MKNKTLYTIYPKCECHKSFITFDKTYDSYEIDCFPRIEIDKRSKITVQRTAYIDDSVNCKNMEQAINDLIMIKEYNLKIGI